MQILVSTKNISTKPQVLKFLVDATPNPQEPPPEYSRHATAGASGSTLIAALTPASINAQAVALRQILADKNKGMAQLAPYVLPGQIDSVQLQHIGYTAIDSALWDMCPNSILSIPHVSLSKRFK